MLPIITEDAWQQELEIAGHMAYTGRKQRHESAVTKLTFFLLFSPDLPGGRFVFIVILSLIKLTGLTIIVNKLV